MSKSFDVSLRKVRMSGYAIKGHGACKFATPYHFGLARVLFQLGQSVTKWNIKLQGGFDPARVVFRLGQSMAEKRIPSKGFQPNQGNVSIRP